MSNATALIAGVAVLYVDPRGPYPGLVAEWWDETRDATKYAGPWPVVAHPPCGPWSSLRSLSRETTRDCAPLAVEMVRKFGGVLEHPRGSKLFEHCRMPKPGGLPDVYGGLTFEVDQCDWGHVARKRTWLYIVGTRDLPPSVPTRSPTHWASGVHTPGARGKPPQGIKICSAEQRRRTPIEFARLLVGIAQKCAAYEHRSRVASQQHYAGEG